MKKHGILNGELAGQIASMGHQDLFLLCNARLAIPSGIPTVDLAVCADVPAINQVLSAILEETEVEYYFLPEELEKENSELYEQIRSLLATAKEEKTPNVGFKSFTRNVKFAVRTGEMTPYAYLIMRAGNPS